MSTSTVIAALLSSSGRAAVAAGDTGAVIRIARQALGWNQHELARRSGYTQPTISRLERGVSRAGRDVTVLADLAGTLGVPPSTLGVLPPAAKPSTLDDVDRRTFLSSTIAVAVAAMLPQTVASPAQIGVADVAQCWTGLRRLFELDDHHGGATVYEISSEMANRLQDALRRGTYGPAVAQELQAVTAASMEHTGWLAYDAGRTDAARRWWLETCHLADVAALPQARVTALTSMALHATTSGAPREALDLISAAQSIAGSAASPTLLSLLSARQAVALAQTRNAAGAKTAIATARRFLDRGKQPDEPLWLEFWNPADLACHETRVALALGEARNAEQFARSAVEFSDSAAFPRNHAIYELRLGRVLARVGQLDESIAVTGRAINNSEVLSGSRRIAADLHATLSLLDGHDYGPAKTFAQAARKIAPVPA